MSPDPLLTLRCNQFKITENSNIFTPKNYNTMTALTQLWKEQTFGFSTIQKALLGFIVLFILFTAVSALVLVYLELTK